VNEIEGEQRASPLTLESFDVLYPRLRRFAAIVGDRDIEADDLVQEALSRYLRRFDGTGGADDPEAYLKVAIVGITSNHRRSMARRRRSLQQDSNEVNVPEYPSDVWALLEPLSPDDRALMTLVDLEGEAIARAADVLGITVVAARGRLSRSRRRLRAHLGEEESSE
jgi:RNA polymerase sigma-70 factor (ECF subfamily)